jgi:hypothetical protein
MKTPAIQAHPIPIFLPWIKIHRVRGAAITFSSSSYVLYQRYEHAYIDGTLNRINHDSGYCIGRVARRWGSVGVPDAGGASADACATVPGCDALPGAANVGAGPSHAAPGLPDDRLGLLVITHLDESLPMPLV